MTENERDVELLHTNPNRLIVKYQKHLRNVVRRCVVYRWFPSSEFPDILQTVNVELVRKIEVIRQQYNGTTLLKTYVCRIALNTCRKLHERHPESDQFVSLSESTEADEEHIHDRLIIQETTEALRTTLLLYGHRLPKIALFLAVLCKMPISKEDILECYPHCPEEDLASVLSIFSKEYDELFDTQIMEHLAPLINKMEGSTTSPDGYRRWMNGIIDEICNIMNGHPPHSHLTRENIFFLFEQIRLPVSRKKGYVHNERGHAH